MTTTYENVYGMIQNALTETFQVPAGEVRPDAEIGTLELDSLAVAELTVMLSEQLGVAVTEGGVTAETTLAEFAQQIESAAAGQDPAGHLENQ
ncbi:acyl carrier protein [Streptomyces sp. NBC_00102]|uniref:acyl carrier protein n=1 Tax=Streptomyces sp. NBC_00102 TaxID=2975652 RepID=UPI00224DEA1D|nr:acyl carrier protein [Streptomyces sp. NBC_00102]MCX5395490.1 acyl carrier protein [Streptomyces sp. NBC_00102]